MANNKINIEFIKTDDSTEVQLSLAFEGANVMEIAVAALQLRSVVEQQIGVEEANVLFNSLKLGSTEHFKFDGGKPTTEA